MNNPTERERASQLVRALGLVDSSINVDIAVGALQAEREICASICDSISEGYRSRSEDYSRVLDATSRAIRRGAR